MFTIDTNQTPVLESPEGENKTFTMTLTKAEAIALHYVLTDDDRFIERTLLDPLEEALWEAILR
jgi:hypothetical protein